MKEKYLNLQVGKLNFQVKLENEGVVLDVFNDKEEVIATTYKFYNEFNVEVKHLA